MWTRGYIVNSVCELIHLFSFKLLTLKKCLPLESMKDKIDESGIKSGSGHKMETP